MENQTSKTYIVYIEVYKFSIYFNICFSPQGYLWKGIFIDLLWLRNENIRHERTQHIKDNLIK